MEANMMILNPDHPAYSDQPDERDPTRECPHGVTYAMTCHDCEEEREADDQSDTGLLIVEPDEEAEHE
jgi:hypothetical protein